MKLAYRIGWHLCRWIAAVYLRPRAAGTEHVPLSGPVILAANHQSFLDPPLIGSRLRREINYLARASLFRVPVLGFLLRQWNVVPVERGRPGSGAAGLKAILDRLLAGGAVILFPEGTRSYDGEFLPAQSGVGLLVAKSSAPVVPVRVFGTFQAYSRQMQFPRPRPVGVAFGQPMLFEKLRQEAGTASKTRQKETYQAISNQIMAAIAQLQQPKR